MNKMKNHGPDYAIGRPQWKGVTMTTALHEPMYSLKKYKVHFVRDVDINPDSCIILEANSSYFFFYNESLKKAYVIPKDDIVYIETNR